MKTKYFSKTLTKLGVTITAIFAVLLVSFSVQAQCPSPTYNGSQIVCVGDVTTYTVTNPVVGATYNWSVSVSYGTILSTGLLPPLNLPYVSVRWDNPATGTQAWVRASYTTGSPDFCNVVGNQYYVTVNPLPIAYQFQYSAIHHYYSGDNTSTAYYCHENNGVTLSVLGSDNTSPATTYELRRTSDDVTFATVNGTGSAINFTNVTVQNHLLDAASSTQYYVVARNPQVCQTSMLGNVVVHKFAKVLPGVIATTTPVNIGACQAIAPAFTSSNAASGGYGALDYQWQININGGVFNDLPGATAATYTHAALTTPATYVFRRKVTNHCATVYSNEISITVDPVVTANAGLNKTIGICTPSVVIDGSGTGTATLIYSWDPATNLSAANIAAPTFNNPGIAGTYNYVLTVTDAYGCTATDAMSVTVDPAPTANVGGPYGVNLDNKLGACSGQQIAIDATATGTTTGIEWSGTGAAFLNYLDIEYPIFSGAPTGTYSLIMTVTDTYGCQASATLTLTVDPLPTADAGDDKDLGECSGQSVVLDGSGTGTGISYLWSLVNLKLPGTFLNDETLAQPTFSGAPAGVYDFILTVTDAYGCVATDAMTVEVLAAPVADAGVNAQIGDCPGQAYQLNATLSTGTSIGFEWSPATYLDVTNTATPTFSGAPAGTYTYTLTVTDVYGCTDTDEVVIQVIAAPTVDLGSDLETCINQAIDLEPVITGSNILTYIWTGSGESQLDNASIQEPTFSAITAGQFTLTLTVTDQAGCSASDTFTITVHELPLIDAGVAQEVCYPFETTLIGTVTTTISLPGYSWTVHTQPSGAVVTFDTPLALSTGVEVDMPGLYIFQLNVTALNCGVVTDVITVEFFDIPTLEPEAVEAEVCGLVASLEGNVDNDYGDLDFEWTLIGGPGIATFTFADEEDTGVEVSAYGEYTFQIAVTNAPCGVVTATVTVEFFDIPTLEPEAVETEVCGLVASLVGIVYNEYGDLDYEWSKVSGPGAATFADFDAEDTDVEVTAYGEYTFQLAVTNAPCGVVTATVTVEFFDIPTLEPSAVADEVCGLEASLEGNASNIYGDLNFEWTLFTGPGVATFTFDDAEDTGVEVTAYGEYTFQLAVVNGPCGAVTATVTVKFFEPVEPNCPDDMDVCEDEEVFSLLGAKANYNIYFTGNGVVNYTDFDPASADLGENIITMYLENGPCVRTCTFTITVYDIPTAIISGPATVFSGETGVDFEVEQPEIGTSDYYWWASDPAVSFSDEYAYDPTVSFEWPFVGDVDIYVTVDNGICEPVSNTFTVTVKPNQLVGQVKYYNKWESPMPSPFNSNYYGVQVLDHFYVALYENLNIEDYTPWDAVEVVKAEEYYGEDGHPLLTDEVYEAAYAFEYNLNPDADYQVVVWDGGFWYPYDWGYYELGVNWTWNNWKGVNATDALLIQHMVVGNQINAFPNMGHIGENTDTPAYRFFAYDVANVNNSPTLTALDALLTSRRAVGLIPQFPNNKPNFAVAGYLVDETDFNTNNIFGNMLPDISFAPRGMEPYYNWATAFDHYYYTDEMALGLGNKYLNIYYNAVGDVNASYVPAYGGFKAETNTQLITEGQLAAGKGEVVNIPVSLDQAAQLGAFSLGLNYRKDLIEVLGVNYGEDYARISHEEGTVTIAWADRNGINFNAGDVVAVLTVRVLADMDANTNLFELDGFTELADVDANVLNINLKTLALASAATPGLPLTATNYPNPFSDRATISYTLPEAGSVQIVVYNALGQVVTTLVNQTQEAGIHTVNVNRTDLNLGVYHYRITLQGQQGDYSLTKSMIVVN